MFKKMKQLYVSWTVNHTEREANYGLNDLSENKTSVCDGNTIQAHTVNYYVKWAMDKCILPSCSRYASVRAGFPSHAEYIGYTDTL